MKKIFTLLIALALILTTTLGSGITAYAETLPLDNSLKLDGYTVTTLSNEETPNNVDLKNIPSFSSIDEAKEYIESINKDFDEMMQSELVLSDSLNSRASTSITKYNGTPNGINKFYIEIGCSYSTSPTRFSSVTYATSYLTGLSLTGVDWTQTTPTSTPIYRIIDGYRTAVVEVNGTLDTYILINTSFTKVSSTPKSYSAEFYYSDI